MRIGLDLDGCAYNFVAAHRHYLCQTEGFEPEELPEPRSWKVWDWWPLTRDEWHASFEEGVRVGAIFGGQFDYDGALLACHELTEAGHELHVVTHRPLAGMPATAEWLRWAGFPVASVTFTEDKTTVPVDVIIEDNVDNARAVIATGADAILIDRPWNRTWNGEAVPGTHRLHRAHRWGDVVHLIEAIADARELEAGAAGEAVWGLLLPPLDLDSVMPERPPRPNGWHPGDYGLEPEHIADPRPEPDPELEGLIEEADTAIEATWGLALPPLPESAHPPGGTPLEVEYVREVEPVDDETNPKDAIGRRKPPLWLVPRSALIRVAQAMADGARKYGPYNWRTKRVSATVYVSAIERHLAKYLDGEDIDPDSGVPHLGHIGACAGILIDATETGNLVDDRPTPGAAARLIAELTEVPA